MNRSEKEHHQPQFDCNSVTLGTVLVEAIRLGLGMNTPNRNGDWRWIELDLVAAIADHKRTRGDVGRSLNNWKADKVRIGQSSFEALVATLTNGERYAGLWQKCFEQARNNTELSLQSRSIQNPASLENPILPGSEEEIKNTTEFPIDATTDTLTKLLALQYPWGEWSDRRTGVESIAAERMEHRGVEGPKPNMARTIFSLDALEPFRDDRVVDGVFQSALRWLRHGISGGWFQEWAPSQTIDSEDFIPSIIQRKDVRHTAQAAIALSKWSPSDGHIAGLVQSISSCRLDSGFWSESPGLDSPRLLATVYAIEALGRVTAMRAGDYVKLLLGEANSNKVWASFRYGMVALHGEADLGGGLLGRSFGAPTAYLTGMALFRLAPLVGHPDVRLLVEKFVVALEGCKSSSGWIDAALSPILRGETLNRTTLRVAAGLSLCQKYGVYVDPNTMLDLDCFLLDRCVGRPLLELDTPDLACLQIYWNSRAKGSAAQIAFSEIEKDAKIIRSQLLSIWKKNFEAFSQHAQAGINNDIFGYRPLIKELQDKHRILVQLGAN